MLELHYHGSVFEIDETRHDFREVWGILQSHKGDYTWLFLTGGRTVHFTVPNDESYALVTDASSHQLA